MDQMSFWTRFADNRQISHTYCKRWVIWNLKVSKTKSLTNSVIDSSVCLRSMTVLSKSPSESTATLLLEAMHKLFCLLLSYSALICRKSSPTLKRVAIGSDEWHRLWIHSYLHQNIISNRNMHFRAHKLLFAERIDFESFIAVSLFDCSLSEPTNNFLLHCRRYWARLWIASH